MTPLDRAHAAMAGTPDDPVARLSFYERLADAELFLLLDREPDGDALDPALFDVSDGRYVLAFDLSERLSDFALRTAPYAALSGRTLAEMLAGRGIGLALNPDVAPSAILIPPDAISWLRATLSDEPSEHAARPARIAPPTGLPRGFLGNLDAKLAAAAGRARSAYLVDATYEDGSASPMLAFVGALPGAERALARAVREALVFSGLEAGALDVTFLGPGDPLVARLDTAGLRFDLPSPHAGLETVAPGSDPDRPPRLR